MLDSRTQGSYPELSEDIDVPLPNPANYQPLKRRRSKEPDIETTGEFSDVKQIAVMVLTGSGK